MTSGMSTDCLTTITLFVSLKDYFHLAHFPASVLGLILGIPSSSYLIINLWKCGDLQLNSKLASGVYYARLSAEQVAFNRVPLLLSELRGLRHLHLESTKKLFDDTQTCLNALQNLPKGLTCFKFDVPGLEPFVRFKSEHPLKDYLPTGLTELYLYIDEESPLAAEHLPSNLLRLGLLSGYTSVPHDRPFFANLPRGLLFIDGTLHFERVCVDDVALAPPQLESISEIVLACTITDWSWFPRLATKCSLKCYNWRPSQTSLIPVGTMRLYANQKLEQFGSGGVSFLGNLPRSLQKLHIKIIQTLTECIGDDFFDLSLWPSNLTSLSIQCRFFSEYALLPPTLTSLALDTVDYDDNARNLEFRFEQLPPNLIELHLTQRGLELRTIDLYYISLNTALHSHIITFTGTVTAKIDL